MHNIPSDLIIRKAHENDVDTLALLATQLGYNIQEFQLIDRIKSILHDQEHIIYVATVAKSSIVGWAHAYVCQLLVAERFVEIGGLVVEDSYRRRGIGRELMACVDKWASVQNCAIIRLRSNVLRESAHQFYESLAYQNIKTQYTFEKLV
jgi:GNAT superfamily N-acetyltransferase